MSASKYLCAVYLLLCVGMPEESLTGSVAALLLPHFPFPESIDQSDGNANCSFISIGRSAGRTTTSIDHHTMVNRLRRAINPRLHLQPPSLPAAPATTPYATLRMHTLMLFPEGKTNILNRRSVMAVVPAPPADTSTTTNCSFITLKFENVLIIFPRFWGMLRRFTCVQIFLQTNKRLFYVWCIRQQKSKTRLSSLPT